MGGAGSSVNLRAEGWADMSARGLARGGTRQAVQAQVQPQVGLS